MNELQRTQGGVQEGALQFIRDTCRSTSTHTFVPGT